MKSKAIMVSFFALFALAFALSTVTAASDDFVKINDVVLNFNQLLGYGPIAVDVSDNLVVDIMFTSNRDASDVRVKVELEGGGFRDDVSAKTSRFHIVNGSKYSKRLTLDIPSSLDFDELVKDLEISVEISADDESTVREVKDGLTLDLKVQRQEYSLNFLTVDMTQEAVPGDTIALDVVLENNGHEELENVYIKASIPELGIERRIFAGDIDELDERDFCEIDGENDCGDLNREDTVNKRLYMTIPRNAMPGVYEVVIEAFNFDTTITTKDRVVVNSLQSGVLPSVTARSVEVGEETTFDVVLINPNDRMVVYTITPEESKGLIVEVIEPIVTVPADSSRTVKVRVKATESAEEGTHLVTVNVNSESELVRQVNFTVNVEKATGTSFRGTSNAIVILTIVLVIIFVVLLIVLIVLLTKRPAEPEEFGETSYY